MPQSVLGKWPRPHNVTPMGSRTLYRRGFLLGVSWLISLLLWVPSASEATTVDLAGGNRVFLPMQSMKALRDQGVIKQAYDYSCGAAAFATLLTYGLNDPVTEIDILKAAFHPLSQDEEALRKKEGLSLLDLQQIAQARGHKAHGFRLDPAYLSKLRGPVIVFITPRGYEHFAVLKGVRGDRAYVADPSLGNLRMPVYQFLGMWLDETGKGIIFVVERSDGTGLASTVLLPPTTGLPQPEVLSVRQLLAVGTLQPRVPQPLPRSP